MNDVEYVLDFAVSLGNRMLGAGANLERVNDTMTRVCLSYHLESISIYSLSSTIMVSARSADGVYGSRHIAVQPASIHLERLNQLNRLSRTVCAKTPAPSSLKGLLDKTQSAEEYSMLAAMFAALYAEIMAMRQKMPSTVFLYPAIIPLIPGDLLYNTAVNLILQNTSEMLSNAQNCALSLAGMSIGFVLISTFTYYRRIYYVSTDIAHHFLHRK